jgi:hypothetical protein
MPNMSRETPQEGENWFGGSLRASGPPGPPPGPKPGPPPGPKQSPPPRPSPSFGLVTMSVELREHRS